MTIHIDVPALVLGRKEAAASGLSRFWSGRPCRAGHHDFRYVSNRQCVTCNAEKARFREAQRSLRDASYRMYRNTLRRTGMALGGLASPVSVLGCDHATLRDFIEAKFRPGMNWTRYRQWEVDHIEPVGGQLELAELLRRCHYTNLQPLWRRENRQKGGA